jgi:hypothetical protein
LSASIVLKAPACGFECFVDGPTKLLVQLTRLQMLLNLSLARLSRLRSQSGLVLDHQFTARHSQANPNVVRTTLATVAWFLNGYTATHNAAVESFEFCRLGSNQQLEMRFATARDRNSSS